MPKPPKPSIWRSSPPREKPTLLEENVSLRERVRDLEGRITEVEEERDHVREAADATTVAPPPPHSEEAPAPAEAVDRQRAPLDFILDAIATLLVYVSNKTIAAELAHKLANSTAINSLDLIEISKWLKSASDDVKRLKRSEAAKEITE